MGSKRPEQAHVDLLATDIKTRTDDEHIHEEDKHRLHEVRGKLAIPKRGDNPTVEELKGRKRGSGKKG